MRSTCSGAAFCRAAQSPCNGPGKFKLAFSFEPTEETRVNMQYYCLEKGQPFGPLTWKQMQHRVASRQLHLEDLIWVEGSPQWVAAREVPELFPPRPPLPSAPVLVEEQEELVRVVFDLPGDATILDVIDEILWDSDLDESDEEFFEKDIRGEKPRALVLRDVAHAMVLEGLPKKQVVQLLKEELATSEDTAEQIASALRKRLIPYALLRSD